ncbi:hypothetical protein TruAng_001864 [Truncatella angustata]|nr:hypothetical protein TruAng_001864 [Truncatella angustata]
MVSTSSPNHPSSYGPSETALLLLDFHNMFSGFIQEAAEREKLINSTQALLAAARESKTPILHCLIDASRDPLPTSKLADRWAEQYKPAFAGNPEFAVQMSDVAVDKDSKTEYSFNRLAGRVSALNSEGIMELLQEKLGIKSLVLCGFVSSGCVLSTARNGADEGFVITVVPDACWDRDMEVHNTVMDHVIPMTGHTMDLDEAVRVLRGNDVSK